MDHALKSQYVATLAENAQTPTIKVMLLLLDGLIQEARENNDTADQENFLQNKGKIAGYKTLRDYIIRPMGLIKQQRL